jgi:hypothetical protein
MTKKLDKAREGLRDEALASWAEFLESRLHLTGQELRAWLEGWGTVVETELPHCHK